MTDYGLAEEPFNARVAVEAADGKGYYLQFTWQQRLQMVNYMNSIAYNYPENDPPSIDRTTFSMR